MTKDFIKSYWLNELAKKENHHPLTIRNWKKYIKVRIETWSTRAMYKMWKTKTPYGYKYIRWDDVKEIIEKKTWKKIIFS